jgi:hypothetical protein
MTLKITLQCTAGWSNCKPQKYLANYRECFVTSFLSYVAGFCLENTTQQTLVIELLFGMFVTESWKKCSQSFISNYCTKLDFTLLHVSATYCSHWQEAIIL